ncbi:MULTISPECIES: AbgT family transporter [Lysinibacillus]|uniref:AbgT family transporter n=1 Tax=Lysinibacillus TaxID=400634 RepID=UPI001C8B948B|nr:MULTISPECIES: AbgT family transporter [Lysinibacillus]MBX8945571.1 AbgT family transporter [Lysinibacillus sp. K60]UYB49617.1 AbgT family transporter [Lysinibacillus capsici]WDU81602.1 AbgT family transporter [Lysinibacillus sp. G01H]
MQGNSQTIKKKSWIDNMLDKIERAGNKLPDPITLFIILAGVVLVLSWVLSMLGISAVQPGTEDVIQVKNLLSQEGLILILTQMVSTFTGFAPLGLVIVTMIGIGLAEQTGLISAVMKKIVMSAPTKLIVPFIIFTGLVGNLAADAAFIILPPIAAMIFMSIGRNPLAGLIITYAAVAGGFSANILISSLDVLLLGITESAAQIADPAYAGRATMNYYFLIASTFLLVIIGTWVAKKFTEPRFGSFHGEIEKLEPLTALEKRGLKWAGIVTLVYILVIAFTVIPSNGLLRDPATGGFLNSPFMAGIVPIMLFFFLLPGLAYGIAAKEVKNDKEVAEKIFKSIADMAPFIVLAFAASQMIAFFNWSNIGSILAIKGAELLQALNFTGLPMMIGFVLICAFVNLLIASASAKWALLAPIFVPMFLYLGYSPAVTQMAYRVGDSITNPITPMLPYFAILLSFAKRYDKNIGIGTLISSLLPFSVFFAIGWIILFAIWFLFGLPLGPGDYIYLK